MNVHVKPVNDLAEHPDNGCPCAPTDEPVVDGGVVIGRVTVHHSFDGREKTEKDSTHE